MLRGTRKVARIDWTRMCLEAEDLLRKRLRRALLVVR
jgi:hypothetical protein